MELLSGYGNSDDDDEADEASCDGKKRKLGSGDDGECSKKKLKQGEEEAGGGLPRVENGGEDDELPPLPEMFESEDQSVHQDKSKHQGRVRSFKHVVGNYATYVLIPGIIEQKENGRDGTGEEISENTTNLFIFSVPLDILTESRDALMEQGLHECPELVTQDEYPAQFNLI